MSDCSSSYLEGILLIYHNTFLEDLCFSLTFITELIYMKIRYLFHRDSLDPDVCFLCEGVVLFVTLHWL